MGKACVAKFQCGQGWFNFHQSKKLNSIGQGKTFDAVLSSAATETRTVAEGQIEEESGEVREKTSGKAGETTQKLKQFGTTGENHKCHGTTAKNHKCSRCESQF